VAQRLLFDTRWRHTAWRLMLATAFSRVVLGRLYRRG
jgi:hypothetical protein